MLYSVSQRHEKLFESKYQQNKIFNKDVLYGVTISPVIFVLFKIGGESFVMYSYVVSAIVSYIYYRVIK